MNDNAEKQQELQQDPPEVVQLQQECEELESLLEEYNKSLTSKTCLLQELEMENRTLRAYLQAKKEAHSQVMTNYEKCRRVTAGYQQNEDLLHKHMDEVYGVLEQIQEKYASFRAHVVKEMERASKTNNSMRTDYESKISMQISLLKALEVKCNCLTETVNDKTEQCHAMDSLITEVTDKM